MLDITITDPDGKRQIRQFDCANYTIGRGMTSDLRLKSKQVARHHATLNVDFESQSIRRVSKESTLLVNGENLDSYEPLRIGDEIKIGDYVLEVTLASHGLSAPCATDNSDASRLEVVNSVSSGSAPIPHDTVADDEVARYAESTPIRKAIQEQVQTQLDLHKRNQITAMSADELRGEATTLARQIVDKGAVVIPAHMDQSQLIDEVVAEAIGLGPIEPLLADESVTEVMVNGPGQVYVERAGRLQHAAVQFINERSLMSAIERIVTPLGRRIDEGVPMVDARLADGSRVNAIIPPLALNGPTITIRKFSKQRFTMDRLVGIGTLSPAMAAFLEICVKQRKNILISGGTGSGKTTFLNALSDAIPDSERIVTIEDAAELRLSQRHVVSLEARPANVEGKGHVAIRDLVRNSLRMRPDRIVVGECRGGEALDMLQAMNTGHDGSLTTGHANSPRDLLSRLEVMVLMSGMELPVRAIREQIASAVDIVVQQTRFKDGKRRITDIVEIDGMESDVVLMQNLFRFEQQGINEDGSVSGEFIGLDTAPRFYTQLEEGGVALDRSIFNGRWSPAAAELRESA